MKSRIPRRQAAAVAALVVCTSHLARATTPEVARVAIADSTLRRSPANTNEEASGILVVGQAGRNRVVVDFDLAGIEATHVTSARLVLNIKKNVGSWGRSGRTVDVSPLLVPFDEGNGRTFGVPAGERTRGGGPGVTWECSSDAEIADVSTDCAAT